MYWDTDSFFVGFISEPCTVTVVGMNERGIEFAYADQQKLFAPHNDHLTFKCQIGKYNRSFKPRHQCNDGVMTLPKCVWQWE